MKCEECRSCHKRILNLGHELVSSLVRLLVVEEMVVVVEVVVLVGHGTQVLLLLECYKRIALCLIFADAKPFLAK